MLVVRYSMLDAGYTILDIRVDFSTRRSPQSRRLYLVVGPFDSAQGRLFSYFVYRLVEMFVGVYS